MIEKVNPFHPDKVSDRIAGAMVDLAYKMQENPKVAVEVLIGHGRCHVIAESSYKFRDSEVKTIVDRIAPNNKIDLVVVPQDVNLAANQSEEVRCGDNGIFKGVPFTDEQKKLSEIAHQICEKYPSDGKYILADDVLTVCQSNANARSIKRFLSDKFDGEMIINPIGDWTGGTLVDTGATNRKLGSDMADGVTGGGIHGKDLSKADVSVNIYAMLKANETGKEVQMHCSIGDTEIDGVKYSDIVEKAREYVNNLGGFEKLAEWGLY